MRGRHGSRGAEIAIAAALAMGLAAVYRRSAAAPAHQHWDSLSYAASVGSGRYEIWGNHPFPHALQNLGFLVARRLDAGIAALPLLLWLNAVASGLAVAALFLAETRGLGLRRSAALGAALVLAGSYGFWSFSGTADIYSLAILFGACAWAALLAAVRTPSPARLIIAAAATAAAACAHQMQILIALCAAHLLSRTAPEGRALRRAGAYVAATALFAAAGYAVLGILATGSASPVALVAWARGYVGDVRWGGRFDWATLEQAAEVASVGLLRPIWSRGLERGLRALLLGILVLAPVCGLVRARRAGGVLRAAVEAALLQLVALSIVTVWWDGTNPKLWLLALVPYVLAVSAAFRAGTPDAVGRWLGAAGALALSAAVFAFNWGAILERMRPEPRLERALAVWVRHSDPEDVLIPTDELVPHLLFRAGRPETINLDALLLPSPERDLFEPLRTRLDRALCTGRQVLVAQDAGGWVAHRLPERIRVSRESLAAFLARYRKTPAFDYQSPFGSGRVEVYRLSPPACGGEPTARERPPGTTSAP